MTTLPLPSKARLWVALRERAELPRELCALGRAEGRATRSVERHATVLQWTPEALDAGDDAGANLVVRQAPFVAGVHRVGSPTLQGLPGFLADSLPDGWGRLLVDRQLRGRGVHPRTLTGLDRLAIVGDRGPGALSYRPEVALGDPEEGGLDLDALAKASEIVLRGDDAGALLDTLEAAGGSAGGSRPKAWLAEDAAGQLRSGAGPLRAGETGWLVKFRAGSEDPEDIGPMEFAYARMAAAAGLEVAEPRLFDTPRGRYFASRRFDREGFERVHVLTAAGLLNVAAAEALAADYVDLIKLTRLITRSEAEARASYRHAVFNALSHNRDDHLKQFAFLRRRGTWTRTPAYDLTFSHGPGGEHSLLVAGEGRQPRRAQLMSLAERSGIGATHAARIIDEVRASVARWAEFASEVGVGATTTREVAAAIARTLADSAR